ncbi:recombinase XerD [Bacillus sp. AFS041924]|nr:recombinase XerD [Bacillus sp. AFS041924]
MIQGNKQESSTLRYNQIEKELQGYWKDDFWDPLECPLYTKKTNIKNEFIKFNTTLNTRITNEFKYYFFTRLTEMVLKMETVWRKSTALNRLQKFISIFYSDINSILDISYEKFLFHYKSYLFEEGCSHLTVKGYVQLYNRIYSFYHDWYDERNETEKDIWNVRKLGIDYNKSSSTDCTLNFNYVPTPYRELIKKYIKNRLLIQESLSWGSAIQNIAKLPVFFNFVHKKYPKWDSLEHLNRKDIEEFIQHLRTTPMGGNSAHKGKAPSGNYINRSISFLETFIEYIQRLEWNEAPIKPVRLLILPEDKPKLPPKSMNDIKYISDFVWDQIINHIEKLPEEIRLIVLLLEATGFRISDICALKIDCLIHREDGWWITGEQRKVKDKTHRVPISEEIAKIVLKQQELTRRISLLELNPLNYLFPTYSGTRKRQPISRENVVNNINKLAAENKIVDENGDVYRCKPHAFRHRFGVNLINNGMNILHVQKLMAHASPEMTLVYAKIHDRTLRKEWEKASNNGAVKLQQGGKIIATSLKQQADENGLDLDWIRHNLDSIRLDHGFCIKSPKNNCDYLEQTLEPPCIKNNCRSFHVDQTFLDYYKEQIMKIESDIEVYQRSGRIRSIEIIQPKLKKYKEIRDSILSNGGIYGISKPKRELKN